MWSKLYIKSKTIVIIKINNSILKSIFGIRHNNNMRVSLSLVGNYMCKNPPVVLFDITGLHSDRELIKKYFNFD